MEKLIKNKRPTIFDIAKTAGVSYATVSRVFNNKSDVKDETREQILRICEEMNYRPSFMARGLTNRKSWLVGIVFSGDFDHPLFGGILTKIKKVVEAEGYELIFFNYKPTSNISEMIRRIQLRDIDGLIIAGVTQDPNIIGQLNVLDMPVVTINFHVEGNLLSSVSSDQYMGTMLAMNRLWDWGHRNIGCISVKDSGFAAGYLRYKAYQDFLEKKQIMVNENYVLDSDFIFESEQESYYFVNNLIQNNDLPTAFFCSWDIMAFGVIRALKDHGIDVPREVSVIGFDDIAYNVFFKPNLTTVRQDSAQMGLEAANELFRMLHQKDANPRKIIIPTSLIIRDSAGPVSMQKKV